VTQVALTVNGRSVQALVEPRTHLADFLREQLHLTGTHLGCEQGVCGACTISIDGTPQRSCITYAVDCDGSDVRTIEGFDDDPLMAELREAFSAYHALQCGFCTPGMLITARDIVARLGEIADERIREELAGNLCRCTGYVGIVNAVRAVANGKIADTAASTTVLRIATPAALATTTVSAPLIAAVASAALTQD
jgi:aerobic carbon-monoxide dehydrogenase small subunit